MIFADLSFAVFAKSFQLFSEVKLICSFYIYIYFFKMFGTSTSFKVLKVDFFKLSRFISFFFLSRVSLDLCKKFVYIWTKIAYAK